jgi:hypothetical protein
MFTIPDPVGDLLGGDDVRAEFAQALAAVGRFDSGARQYVTDGPFSEAARLTFGLLNDAPLADLTPDERSAVVGSRSLARRIVTSGYSLHAVREAGDHAADDWSQLLAFVQRKSVEADGEGWEHCYTYIVGRCETALQSGKADQARDDAYAVLRHFASFFSGDRGFERRWLLDVPDVE